MREGGTCAIPSEGCPGGFDFSLHHNDPWAFTVHHPVPRAHGGAVVDPANGVPAHRLCNERLGTKTYSQPLEDNHSEDWPD